MSEPIKVEISGNIKHESATPLKVEVTRGQRGSYGWTISVSGTTLDSILFNVKQTDDKLKTMFPQPEGG